MYEWVNGRPALLVRLRDLDMWPGEVADFPARETSERISPKKDGAAAPTKSERFAQVSNFEGASVLSVSPQAALTTAVALELGGLLLVSATYCDDDAAVAEHLDLVPVSGWQILRERFISIGDEYVLVDGSLRGMDVLDPAKQSELLETSGAIVAVNLPQGPYEVELLGPWRPDERTELYLTRLVRESQSGVVPLDEFEEI